MYKHPQLTVCTVCTVQLHCTHGFANCLYNWKEMPHHCQLPRTCLTCTEHALTFSVHIKILYICWVCMVLCSRYTIIIKNSISLVTIISVAVVCRQERYGSLHRLHLPPPWSLPHSPRIHFQGVEDHDQCWEATECELLLSTKLTSQREVTVHVPWTVRGEP